MTVPRIPSAPCLDCGAPLTRAATSGAAPKRCTACGKERRRKSWRERARANPGRAREWRAKNPERDRELREAWQKANSQRRKLLQLARAEARERRTTTDAILAEWKAPLRNQYRGTPR